MTLCVGWNLVIVFHTCTCTIAREMTLEIEKACDRWIGLILNDTLCHLPYPVAHISVMLKQRLCLAVWPLATFQYTGLHVTLTVLQFWYDSQQLKVKQRVLFPKCGIQKVLNSWNHRSLITDTNPWFWRCGMWSKWVRNAFLWTSLLNLKTCFIRYRHMKVTSAVWNLAVLLNLLNLIF